MEGAFTCPACGTKCNSVVFIEQSNYNTEYVYLCKNCSNNLKGIKTTPTHAVHGCDSFTPYYDTQLDSFIESKEHKASLLKELGFTQVSGRPSPMKSSRESIIMTKGQSEAYKAYTKSIRSK